MGYDGTSISCLGMGWDGTEKYVRWTSLAILSPSSSSIYFQKIEKLDSINFKNNFFNSQQSHSSFDEFVGTKVFKGK